MASSSNPTVASLRLSKNQNVRDASDLLQERVRCFLHKVSDVLGELLDDGVVELLDVLQEPLVILGDKVD